jgi:XTP/dITP diphosphohydrolase
MALFCSMEIVFATNNLHKLAEISTLLGEDFKILGLEDLGSSFEMPEDHDTLEQNASQKAWYVYRKTGRNCFADDTGLEVKALGGAPGVFSARYSRIGEPVFPDMEAAEGNIRKLLLKMKKVAERDAQFRTVITLIINGIEYRFEGVVEGEITTEPAGTGGFGYDPVFRPAGRSVTFAEMDLSEKNRISHRARAVNELVQFLKGM